MATFLLRVKLGWKYILKKATDWTAVVYAVAGLISLFVSFEGIFDTNVSFVCKLLIALAILAGVWLLSAIINAIIVGFKNKMLVVEGLNGKNVFVVYGDLFDPQIVDDQKRYICFAVNRCFDTDVNNRLISSTTIHGIAFNKLYEQNLYTAATLNTAIQAAIHTTTNPVAVNRADKPEGNLNRYEAGSYANLSIDCNLNYLLLGLSWINSNLNAQTSKSDYVLAVQKMIESFDNESQGYPVLMPIIGTGRSRTDLKEREALEYIIEAFRINKNKITSDIYIVIHESAKNRVSIADL